MPCKLCQAPKTVKTCNVCQGDVCKNCVRYFDKEESPFFPKVPRVLQKTVFCFDCFEAKAQPEIEKYNEVLDRAREVIVVKKAYRGPITISKKKNETTTVKRKADEKIAVAQLQFLAAWEGFNAVLQLETDSFSKKNAGWETSEWSATGVFAEIDQEKFRSNR